jgi:hypothetical protein
MPDALDETQAKNARILSRTRYREMIGSVVNNLEFVDAATCRGSKAQFDDGKIINIFPPIYFPRTPFLNRKVCISEGA